VEQLAYGRHWFRLRQVGADGTARPSRTVTAVVAPSEGLAVQAYPNPVTADARVTVSTGRPQDVTLTVYDLLGRRVARLYEGRVTPAEPVRRRLDGAALGSGAYFVRAQGGTGAATTRLTVVR
jgi:hypothetical protein